MMKIAILGSGFGSNAEAILQAQKQVTLGKATVVGILSDQPNARILSLGPLYQVPAKYIAPGKYKTKLEPAAEQQYIQQLKAWQTDLVVLAGFMRVIKQSLLQAFPKQIINLHPSLLPLYPGLNSIQRAFHDRATQTGCTVHWVNHKIDAGEIIQQTIVPIHPNDTLEKLEKRVHDAEHVLLPAVIRSLAASFS